MNKWAIGGIAVAVIAIAVVASNKSQEDSSLDTAIENAGEETSNLIGQGAGLSMPGFTHR